MKPVKFYASELVLFGIVILIIGMTVTSITYQRRYDFFYTTKQAVDNYLTAQESFCKWHTSFTIRECDEKLKDIRKGMYAANNIPLCCCEK